MNKALTDGVVFMPPPFADGLDVWSSGDGAPGSSTYDTASNAALVPADQDFDGCVELFKNTNSLKLTYTGQTQYEQGCYLRISAKVKAISGPLPSVRAVAKPFKSNNSHANGYVEVGPSVPLTAYGEVVEVAAIIGSGARNGVDMIWGADVAYGHLGLEFTGSNGAVVRVDDIVIEDVTGAYLRDMMDWVDVRDFGAAGDGVTDDRNAFLAADAAANGRTLLVPEGTFRIANSMTLHADVRFEGTLSMADDVYLSLTRSFDLPTYIDAFGDEMLGFKKAFQALLNYTDHEVLDMCGRRIDVSAPIDMQAAYEKSDSLLIRRVLKNGQFYVNDSAAWDVDSTTTTATYNPNNPLTLTGIGNIGAVKRGALVTGNGVGREVYVKDVNVGANSATLSEPIYGGAVTQNFTFKNFKYVLDFSGFYQMRRFTISEVEFQCNGHASAVRLAREGENAIFQDCFFIKPRNRGITSIGKACQDLHIERCQFVSDEQSVAATVRQSIAFNVNANDAKIRDNRFARMGTTGVLSGGNHIIQGNHIFQGDEVVQGARTAGLVLTNENNNTVITGNYIDNCSIELNNEHDADPNFGAEYSFGGMTITNNIFVTIDAAPWFKFILIKPFGTGHYVSGMHVVGNSFRTYKGTIDRVEGVVTTHGSLNGWSYRNLTFKDNSFFGVNQRTCSPVMLEFSQNTEAATWTLDSGGYLPFDGKARLCQSLVFEDGTQTSSNVKIYDMPRVKTAQGTGNKQVQLKWPQAVRGKVWATIRVDKPI
ncbi:right-handed parallel beta-helix repeat-containing protein [Aliiroseovarius crassostreae]|uniref:right-handed parallel beta-helix repeat-containing protein n=1 Tax=Aliiroseovarius crassostreae TaxID=154981 RepID=UPI0021F099E8|nr:right-handed parallel beta-helix repeat-containing protein [Aliiroseovarius crassostreae]UWQ02579.1 right-handed parallel beta-helix repeat-containing protein [Aliiroseovarius crassostreae]